MSYLSLVRAGAAVAGLLLLSSCGTAASCLGLAACMPDYVAPVGPSVATLDFKLGGFIETHVALGSDPELKAGQYVGLLSLYRDQMELSTTAEGGQRVYLRLIASLPQSRCINVASFVPTEGRTYDIAQVPLNDACAIVVRDRDTGTLPETYEVHDANKAMPLIVN